MKMLENENTATSAFLDDIISAHSD